MHRLDIMREILISESILKSKNIAYLYTALLDITNQVNAKMDIKNTTNRVELSIYLIEDYYNIIKQEIEDKIADIIAVSYKYDYFFKRIRSVNLSEYEMKLLLSSLISADLEEDKRYIIKKLAYYSEYSIDGIFNFRMKPLKEKWQEIASYIPKSFSKNQLKDFIEYIVKDKKGKRVYYENGSLYDKRFNVLRRKELIGLENEENATLIEILLSGAGEVELASPLSKIEEKYLKEFYGEGVIFSDNYFLVPKKSQ